MFNRWVILTFILTWIEEDADVCSDLLQLAIATMELDEDIVLSMCKSIDEEAGLL